MSRSERESPPETPANAFSVPGQIAPPAGIQSVEMFMETPGNPPVITLGSSDQITLRFDQISDQPSLFRVRITHHNADWSESGLIPNFFLRGFTEDTIDRATPSATQHPGYHHFSYKFPNRNFGVTQSGNYLMHIYDSGGFEPLFSIPFFVAEGRGNVRTEVEEYFGFDGFPAHQLFATYRYPEFVILPQTNISIYFAQNQFWGRNRRANVVDISSPGQIRKYVDRDNGFFGRYEFRPLDLTDIRSITRDILEVFPEEDPPRVRLQFDVVNMDVNPRRSRTFKHGSPETNTRSRYAKVEFNLERPSWIDAEEKIYVVGPFNNWTINEENRMHFNAAGDFFRGYALIKEGRYDYKYVVLEDGAINDLRLDAFFSDTRQEYHTFIYYRDQEIQADRLLSVGRVVSR